jgi:hypothetical protein
MTISAVISGHIRWRAHGAHMFHHLQYAARRCANDGLCVTSHRASIASRIIMQRRSLIGDASLAGRTIKSEWRQTGECVGNEPRGLVRCYLTPTVRVNEAMIDAM